MLSPIRNFPLKFLYFDIIKKDQKRFLFSLCFCHLLELTAPLCEEDGVVHMLNTRCKYWAENREDSVIIGVA